MLPVEQDVRVVGDVRLNRRKLGDLTPSGWGSTPTQNNASVGACEAEELKLIRLFRSRADQAEESEFTSSCLRFTDPWFQLVVSHFIESLTMTWNRVIHLRSISHQ
jgi:hypothetical protein